VLLLMCPLLRPRHGTETPVVADAPTWSWPPNDYHGAFIEGREGVSSRPENCRCSNAA
jgi:hypothetical protein